MSKKPKSVAEPDADEHQRAAMRARARVSEVIASAKYSETVRKQRAHMDAAKGKGKGDQDKRRA